MEEISWNEFSIEESVKISQEFNRVKDKIYLDHAGTTLYSEKQIDSVSRMLKDNLFCNPHTCRITADLVDQVRLKILKSFNADPNEYKVIFTQGTSAGLKIVAECFDFGETGEFYYCQENHTSVLGMREVVNTENIFVLTKNEILENIVRYENQSENIGQTTGKSLIAFSAQCNLSGYKMPLEIIESIKSKQKLANKGKCIRGTKGKRTNKYFICLDAASFVATNFLNLGKFKPDFVCISFYKIFGYPTGLGALIVNFRGQQNLQKRYFGGGTVKISMTREDFHVKRDDFTAKFEDGTISFLSISALLEGFRTHERLVPPNRHFNSAQRISNHVFQLSKYCYNSLNILKYKNGEPLVKIYSHTNFESSECQGGIICFNVLYENGSYVGFSEIACIATVYNIILRCGCFCNPGACQTLLNLNDEEVKKHYQAGHICSDYNDLVDGVPTGAVRLSFGYMTTKKDVDAVINMIKCCYLNESENDRINKIVEYEMPKILEPVQKKFLLKSKIRLKSIFVYPVKSCGYFKITNEWEVDNNGLKYDRNWMIVDSNGVAVTQKTIPRICLISPKFDFISMCLQLTFPDNDSINIPLEFNDKQRIDGKVCQSKVCTNFVKGLDCGDAVAEWLSHVLECAGLRLIKQIPDWKSGDGSPNNLNLSNKAQFLLINSKSVEWLASKIENHDNSHNVNDIDGIIKRFRANFVIETLNPLVENQIKILRIGDLSLTYEEPCTRCQMICIDQNTGIKTAEPLKTISKEFQGKIRFGIYLSQTKSPVDGKLILSCFNEVYAEYF